MPKIEEKPETYADRERALLQKWQNEGKSLVHYCEDWDGMLICAESQEILACTCDFVYDSHKLERKEAQERLRLSHDQTAIGDDGQGDDEVSAEIHSPDFSAKAARPRLGLEIQDHTKSPTKPFVFPIIKQGMTLSDAMSYLVNLQATKGCLIFWSEEHQEPTFVNFGDLSRAEMVYALERTKHEEILMSFTSDEEDDE